MDLRPHRKNTTKFGIILLNRQFVPSSDLGLGRTGFGQRQELAQGCRPACSTQRHTRPFAWELLFTLRLKTKSKACKYLISLASYCLSGLMCEGTPCAALINSGFRRLCRTAVAVPAVAGPMQRQRRPALCSQQLTVLPWMLL